jgi:NAD(P)-dependent dehydrogenase (short-subunit alcohol dehydrogenase family)
VRLDGQVVVVLGGSSGIGLACAAACAGLGAAVTIAARDPARLARAAATVGPSTRAVSLDVSDEGAVAGLFDAHERVDHVVVTAGRPVSAPVLTTDLAVQQQVMDVRFWAALYACRHGAQRMRGHGSFTLVSGAATARPRPGRPVGVAAGSAVEGLAKAMALELAPRRVNVVAPGPTRTAVLERHSGAEVMAALGRQLPVGRLGEPGDLAHAVVFLMTNGFITGVTLRVDGGYVVA